MFVRLAMRMKVWEIVRSRCAFEVHL